MAPVTVADIMGMAFPRGTVLLAGERGLGREVIWARRLRARLPAFDALESGELALLPRESIGLVDDRLTLPYVVRALVSLNVSAIAVEGPVDGEAAETAEATSTPLFQLPVGTGLAGVEKSVISLIVNRQAEMQQRGTEIYRELAQLALEDRGLPAIARRLRAITGKMVVVEDEDFRIICTAGDDLLPTPTDAAGLVEMLSSPRDLPAWTTMVRLTSTSPPVALLACRSHGFSRFVAPVIVRDALAGYVSILGPEVELAEIDRVAASRSAAVVAMEMSKHLAVIETENRLRGGIVDDLLSGNVDDEKTMIARAKQLGHDIGLPHGVAVVATEALNGREFETREEADRRARRAIERAIERAFTRGSLRPLCRPREDKSVVLFPLGPEESEASVRERAAAAHRSLLESNLMATVSIGVGRVHEGLSGLAVAYREAEQALLVGQKLYGKGYLALFGELGIYRLFFRLKGTPELRSLYEETIAKIVAYDQKHESELLKTLETFFACLGNLSRTADTLYLHRNTLIYRMERIREITGLNLDDAESRLALQVALKMRLVM